MVIAFDSLPILRRREQIKCQSHKLTAKNPVTFQYTMTYIASLKQKYTHNNRRKLFGISCSISHWVEIESKHYKAIRRLENFGKHNTSEKSLQKNVQSN